MIGAGRLNVETYEHVEADPRSTAGSVVTVVLSTLAAGIGGGLTGAREFTGLLLLTAFSWLVWVGLTYFIGTRLLPGPSTRATFGQVLRTTGFSASPGILRVFGVIPVVGWPIFMASTAWMLATFVVAIRQALDFESTWRALFVSLLGWLIYSVAVFAFVLRAI
jgi:hypothetical protein